MALNPITGSDNDLSPECWFYNYTGTTTVNSNHFRDFSNQQGADCVRKQYCSTSGNLWKFGYLQLNLSIFKHWYLEDHGYIFQSNLEVQTSSLWLVLTSISWTIMNILNFSLGPTNLGIMGFDCIKGKSSNIHYFY